MAKNQTPGGTSSARSDQMARASRKPWWRQPIVTFVLLLVLPVIALITMNRTGSWIGGIMLFVSILTFFFYWQDKRRARKNGWRVPESTLHILEFLGGWPGAFIAQRFLHHKSTKRTYQLIFWIIVLVHQIVALDFIFNGAIRRLVLGGGSEGA